jgi:Flp pilus assembly pilin Flp
MTLQINMLRRFARNESGAVTAEYVLLTAALVMAVSAVIALVGSGANDLAENTQAKLAAIQVGGSDTASAGGAGGAGGAGIVVSPSGIGYGSGAGTVSKAGTVNNGGIVKKAGAISD